MKEYINDNFLLETKYAEELYHKYAKDLPIIDYHCHLSPKEIATNHQYENLTRLWIDGDHYKWRAMRNLGVPEKYISGNASDYEKFRRWAYTIPFTIRNPLYHWSHLELKRFFGIDVFINPDSGNEIYEQCNSLLKTEDFYAQGLVKSKKVEVICTTNGPLDDLTEHSALNESDAGFKMLPTFRPDPIIEIENEDFVSFIESFATATDVKIIDLDSLFEAIRIRIDYFHAQGCMLSDHGLPYAYAYPYDLSRVKNYLASRLKGKSLTVAEVKEYKSAILHFLGTCYADKGWTMQLHLGPVRNTNKAMLQKVGLDAGVDSIGDYPQAEHLAIFLDALNQTGKLPKTILYNSNPADNDLFATMAGNFNEEGVKGKVQFGAAWWFLDQKDGIEKHVETLSNMSLLSSSIGMLTDSRSILSFTRHEYYRRVLCNVLGNDIDKGLIPGDIKWLGEIVANICYYNSKEYFNFQQPIWQSVNEIV